MRQTLKAAILKEAQAAGVDSLAKLAPCVRVVVERFDRDPETSNLLGKMNGPSLISEVCAELGILAPHQLKWIFDALVKSILMMHYTLPDDQELAQHIWGFLKQHKLQVPHDDLEQMTEAIVETIQNFMEVRLNQFISMTEGTNPYKYRVPDETICPTCQHGIFVSNHTTQTCNHCGAVVWVHPYYEDFGDLFAGDQFRIVDNPDKVYIKLTRGDHSPNTANLYDMDDTINLAHGVHVVREADLGIAGGSFGFN